MTTTDENKAFVKEMLGLKKQNIAEHFTFAGRKLVDVRVHVCDAQRSPT